MDIGYVNLFVSDLEQALSFYRDLLGMTVQHKATEHGYASLAAGPVSLGLAVPGDDQQALLGRHTGIGLVVRDLEAEYARLSAAGVSFTTPPTRQPWGGFMALVNGPDGNILYLDQVSATHS